MHAGVRREIDVLGHRARQPPAPPLGVAAVGPGEGEHRAVVVGVDVQVEQRRAARGRAARRARARSRPSDTFGTHSSTRMQAYGRVRPRIDTR